MKNKTIIRRLVSCAASVAVFSSIASVVVLADGSPEIVSIRSTDEGVYVYTSGDPISDINIQVGESLTTVTPVDVPIRTMLLVDNSISTYETLVRHASVTDEERAASTADAPLPGNIEGDSIVPFLQEVVAEREDGEIFRVGTFDDDITWLSDWSTDYDSINGSIASITYQDYSTSVADCLYDAVNSIPDDGIYTRIVLISDCVDDEEFPRTYNEFSALESGKQVGVYLVDIDLGSNTDDVAEIMSMVRCAPQNDYISTSDGGNLGDFYDNLNEDRNLQAFYAVPETNVFTGSSLGVIVNMTTEYGEYTAVGGVVTPIVAVTPSPTPTPAPTATPTPEPTATPTPEVVASVSETSDEESDSSETSDEPEEDEDEVEEEKNDGSYNVVVIVIMCVLLVGGIGFAVWYFIFKNKGFSILKKKNPNALAVVKTENSVTPVPEKPKKRMVPVFNKGKTAAKPVTKMVDIAVFLALKGTSDIEQGSYIAKRFKNDQLVIGTDPSCDFCIDDGTLGPKHCIISKRNNQYFIKDLGNANPTKYNGVEIVDQEMMINTGGVLDIGREQFKVEFKIDEVSN